METIQQSTHSGGMLFKTTIGEDMLNGHTTLIKCLGNQQ